MKEKLTGIISFLGGLGWTLFGLYMIFIEKEVYDEDVLIMFLLMIPSVSIILYVIWTKFGEKQVTELDKLEFENQILEKKIEQKKLNKILKEEIN